MKDSLRKRHLNSQIIRKAKINEGAFTAPKRKKVRIERLPDEILTEITGYLPLKQLVALREVNRNFKRVVNYQYQHYSHYYERLRKIEPSLAPVLPQDNFLKSYHEAFEKVKNIQEAEMAFLRKNHTLSKNSFRICHRGKLSAVAILEQQSSNIDMVNTRIISEKIARQANTNEGFKSFRARDITRIPSMAFDLNAAYWKNVNTIFLEFTLLRSLPEEIGKCQKLKTLFCCNNKQLKSLPEALGDCQALKRLYCFGNQIEALPASIVNCQALEYLDCSYNQISKLPELLGNCQQLGQLRCIYNRIGVLPKSLENCKALEIIYCSFNRIHVLPQSLGNCDALERLVCDDNQLSALPESLGLCRKLEYIAINNNRVTSLPESLSNCPLNYLYCSNNKLTSVPDKIVSKMGTNWAQSVLESQGSDNVKSSFHLIKDPITLSWLLGSKRNNVSAREVRQLHVESAAITRDIRAKRRLFSPR